MYLDTLKVSTLEQTAEETSARGGKGNPELITWDYGKEISLSLEDALYTPASQSLMWGGKFGIKKPKVQGLWNPLAYPKDEYGRTQYLKRIPLTAETDNNGEITLTNPDGETVSTYSPNTNAPYFIKFNGVKIHKYTDTTDHIMDDRTVTVSSYYNTTYVFGKSFSSNPFTTWTGYFQSGGGHFYDEDDNEIIFSEEERAAMVLMLQKAQSLVQQSIISKTWLLLNEHNIPALSSNIPIINPDNLSNDDVLIVSFICPCDGELKAMQYEPNTGEYKYENLDDWAVGYKCPKGYNTGERKNKTANTAKLVKTYYWNIGGDESIVSQLAKAKEIEGENYKGRPERAEIVVDNYGDFNFNTFDMQVLEGTLNGDTITIERVEGADNFCIYTPIEKCDGLIGDSSTACGSSVAAYGYEWNKVDMKMVSFEGDQDIYYLENANLRYRVPRNSTQKEIMIGRQGFYETVYNQSADPQWVKISEDAEEITNIADLTRQNVEEQSYGYFVNPYDATVDFFMNIQLNLPISNNQVVKRFIRVPLGRFYIIADWNFGGDTPYDLIHPIDSGMENVPVLDRMEKCKATQTFAIDANKNLAMANYRYMQEYAEAPLTVFIDPKTMKPYEPNSGSFTRQNGDVITGNLRIIKQYEIYYKWTRTITPPYTTLGHRIIVDAEHFPGTYRIVGETYCRSRDDGKDQRYQFEIPLAKLSSETNLSLQADGDPTTFTMKFKVLRRDDGVMMKLTQYLVDCNSYDGYTSGSTKVVPTDTIEDNTYDTIYTSIKEAAIRLVEPNGERNINEELNGEVSINENINAVLDTSAVTTAETYNTQTLEVVDRQVVRTENTEQLNHDEYTVTVENLDEEVGE